MLQISVTTGGKDTGVKTSVVVALVAIVTGFVIVDDKVATDWSADFLAVALHTALGWTLAVFRSKTSLLCVVLETSGDWQQKQSHIERKAPHQGIY